MTGAVTYEHLQWFLAELLIVASLAAIVWRFLLSKLDSIRSETAAVARDLADYKLKVAHDYAKNGYIKDVESRLSENMGKLIAEIHALNARIDRVLTTLVEQQKKTGP